MANPQKEDGFTAIANDTMDALCRIRIPGEERQVLDCILRKTYGWNKTEDAVSLSQFVEMTGINKPCVVRAIQGLLSKKIIIVIEKDNAPAKVYSFNKDFDHWQPLSKKITLSKKIISVIKKDNPSLSKKIPTKDTTTKDTITKDKQCDFLIPDWMPEELWKAYLEVRKKKRAPSTKHALNLCIKSINKLHEQGNNRIAVIEQSVERGYTGFFELKTGGNNGNQNASGYRGNFSKRETGFGAGGHGLQEYTPEPRPSDADILRNQEKLKELTAKIAGMQNRAANE